MRRSRLLRLRYSEGSRQLPSKVYGYVSLGLENTFDSVDRREAEQAIVWCSLSLQLAHANCRGAFSSESSCAV